MATRRERVILEVEDNATNPLLRSAAAAKVLDKSLNDLDGSGTRGSRGVDRISTSAVRADRDINKLSGRIRLFADLAATLGPALVPIGAVLVPAVTALASQLGAAAIGAGVAVVAFQGVGEALEAVNDAALEPTTENLETARLAMERLAPEAQEFVRQIQDMRPAFEALQQSAAAGLFPGLTRGLAEAEAAFDRIERVLYAVGDAAGDLAADFGEGLAGPRGQEFLAFIGGEVPRALTELGHTVGNLASGLAEMWMAFTPINTDVTGWLLESSRAFDRWADGLSRMEGFKEFIAYLRENGPKVGDALGALGNAFLQIVEAAAPLGGPTLAAIEAFADVVAAIADSSYGPALVVLASGLTLISRSMQAFKAIKASALFTGLAGAADGAAASMSRLKAAGVGATVGLTAAFVIGEKLVDIFSEDLPGLEQLTGSLIDLSSGVGTLPDEFNSLADSIERITNPSFFKGQTTSDTVLGIFGTEGRTLSNATEEVEALDAALSNLATTGGADAARNAFAELAQQQGLSVDQTKQLLTLLPGYTEALARAANEEKIVGEEGAAAGDEAAAGFRKATGAAQQFRDAVIAATRALEGRASVRDYEQALDDLTSAVKQNGKTLDVTTQKGRDNQAALDNIASSALTVAENMKGTNRVEFLQAARKDMVDAAMKLGLTRQKAQDLADRLLGLDKMSVEPKIDADTRAALSGIGVVSAQLKNLNGQSATVYVRSRVEKIAGSISGMFGGAGADGMTVPGPRFPYRDKMLIFAAPGEEVISNRHGQADAFRADRAAGRIPAYASGGTVGLGNTYASTRNLPVDSATRSLARFDAALVESSRGLRSELTQRLESATKIRDAEKARLDSLKEQQKALVESVQSLYRGEVFGRSADFGDAPVSAEFRQAAAVTTARNVLTREIAEAREAFGLLRELRQKGFDGPLFRELAASGDVLALRGFADLSRRELREYENLYSQRQRVSTRAGEMAGRDLQPAIDRQVAEVRETNREIRALRSEVAQMRRQDKDAPERTGREVGEVINKAARAGVKGRGR